MSEIRPLSEHYISNYLKQKARRMKRELKIKQADALNKVANEEGFSSWNNLTKIFNNEYLDTLCYLEIRREDFKSNEDYQVILNKKKLSQEDLKKLRRVSAKAILGAKHRSLKISPPKNVIQFVCDESDFFKVTDENIPNSQKSNNGVFKDFIYDPHLQHFLQEKYYSEMDEPNELFACRLTNFNSDNIEEIKDYIRKKIEFGEGFARIFVYQIWVNGVLILDETDYEAEDVYYKKHFGRLSPRAPTKLPKDISCVYEEIGKK